MGKLKGKRSIFVFVFSGFFLGFLSHATPEKLVRVTVDKASIKEAADVFSKTLILAPLGSVLESETKEGEWFRVWFERDGIRYAGFIHELFVEELKPAVPETAKTETSPAEPDPSQKKPIVAVMDLIAQNVSGDEAGIITGFIQEELFFTNAFSLIERSRVLETARRFQDQTTGICDLRCALQVGKSLKTDQIIIGSVGKLGEHYSVQIKLVDVGSNEILNMSSIRQKCEIWELPSFLDDLISQLMSSQDPQQPPEEFDESGDPPEKKAEDTQISEGALVSLQSVDVEPAVIKSIAPRLDRKMIMKNQKVMINLLISENGKVLDAVILGGSKLLPAVSQAVLDAVKQWEFRSALKSGVKVKVWKTISLRIK